MDTREMKALIYESIENIHDEVLLMTIKEILERQYTPKNNITLADWQIKRIEESKQQIKEGKFYSDRQANDIIDKWLNE